MVGKMWVNQKTIELPPYIFHISLVSTVSGRSLQHIKSEVAVQGDLGVVAMGSRSTQRTMFTPPPLTVTGVFNKLKENS